MTFQPVVPLSGIAGWAFLQRTYEAQFEAFNQSPALDRETQYFREAIGTVETAGDLIADRRLLTVALGAFGLSDDLDNRAFLQRILEDGTSSPDALANRLADDRYRKFSDAFGFGPNQSAQIGTLGFSDRVINLYERQSFEIAVGTQDDNLRIALFAQRELTELASDGRSQDAQWFSVMGQPPLRRLIEGALGLPASIGQIDIDQQLTVFQQKARERFGTDRLSELVEPERMERVTNAFLARAQIDGGGIANSSASIALTLLASAQQL